MRILLRSLLGLVLLLGLLTTITEAANTIKVNSSGIIQDSIPLSVTDSGGVPLTGKTLSDLNIYYACNGVTISSAFNESGATFSEITPSEGQTFYLFKPTAALSGCTLPNVMTVTGGGTGNGIVIQKESFDIVLGKPGDDIDPIVTIDGTTTATCAGAYCKIKITQTGVILADNDYTSSDKALVILDGGTWVRQIVKTTNGTPDYIYVFPPFSVLPSGDARIRNMGR